VFEAYARRTFVEKQGGWYEVQPPGLEVFPVTTTNAERTRLVSLLVQALMLLALHQPTLSDAQETRDRVMLAYWEQILNGLVYELYFPQELHGAGLRVFDLVAQANLPEIGKLAESKKLPALREKFQQLYDNNDPLRIALDKLQTLDVVRIIEGKA
jgi:hypothetical protein